LNQNHIIQINKDNPIISEKHTASIGMEKHAAIEPDKTKFFDFANSVNLRGTSGEIGIYFNSKKIGTEIFLQDIINYIKRQSIILTNKIMR